jgi:hypothetical protein
MRRGRMKMMLMRGKGIGTRSKRVGCEVSVAFVLVCSLLTMIVASTKMRRRMRRRRMSLAGMIRNGWRRRRRRRSEGEKGMMTVFRVVVSFPALRIVP